VLIDEKCEVYYRNGDKYFGDFKDGKKNGIGEIIWKNGNKYRGEFTDDKKNDKGEYF
jgi:hypothetical protein